MRKISSALVFVLLMSFHPFVVTFALAGDSEEVKTLKKQVQSLQRTVEQLQQTIQTIQKNSIPQEELQRRVEEAVRKQQTAETTDTALSPLDQALKEAGIEEETREPTARATPARPTGSGAQRLIDLSFLPSFFAGASTARDESLQTLQGGGHDPHKRGFTLAQGEIGLSGAVDPYFRGQAYIVTSIDALTGETNVELEEAFLSTLGLPYGLQLEVGHFLTEFGQINPRHPHQWDWIDQPIVNTRMFGGEGLRSPGMRLGWLTPATYAATFTPAAHAAINPRIPLMAG